MTAVEDLRETFFDFVWTIPVMMTVGSFIKSSSLVVKGLFLVVMPCNGQLHCCLDSCMYAY